MSHKYMFWRRFSRFIHNLLNYTIISIQRNFRLIGFLSYTSQPMIRLQIEVILFYRGETQFSCQLWALVISGEQWWAASMPSSLPLESGIGLMTAMASTDD